MGRGSAGAGAKAAGAKASKAGARSAAQAGETKEQKDERKLREAAGLFDTHGDPLTYEEFHAASKYQGMYYVDVNAHLRGLHVAKPDIQAQIPHLEAILNRTTLNKATTLYRGIAGYEGFNPAHLRPGHVIEDKGFVSTSIRKSVADAFADELGSTPSIVVRVKAPKGTAGLPIFKIGTGSTFQNEAEVLLPRGTAFRIKSIRKDKKGVYRATAEIVR